ncbi:DUF6602 domain-containing protein [Gimesia maris]|uniref:DUF6602 domain-containing protein n=1 Tax=Gimesia maris TaxID=122 RepID=UPI00241CF8BF|nr:DUF6602 domain-containing protein [Gimesia maris]|tara:strand:+ start:110036 stop:110848 length:813 start_codon:yes stop_codon:yes gene_type:complete
MAKKKTRTARPARPDLVKYFQTIRAELDAVKDRIRSLIEHWPTDGAHKEAALRSVLRRHLPASLELARGFVVGTKGSSSEIDLLVIDKGCPTLFRDEGVVIVSPHFVRAIIEVKTQLVGDKKIAETIEKLRKNKAVCQSDPGYETWAGLFVYEGRLSNYESILRLLGKDWNKYKMPIDGVAFGPDLLIRHIEGRPYRFKDQGHMWCSWGTPQLAASYFIASMLDDLDLIPQWDKRLWFPPHENNEWLKYLSFGGKQLKRATPPKPPKSKE